MCPSAEAAIAQLIQEQGFANIAPIHFIRNVSPEADYVWRKFNFYYNGYVPYHVFDGLIEGNWSSYNDFLNGYNQRHTVSSPLTISLLSKSLTSTTASASVRVTLHENIPAGLNVYIFLWEDHVQPGSVDWRYVERAYTTKTLTITQANQTEDFSHSFNVESSWKQTDMGFTVLIHAPTDKEVRNGYATKFLESAIAPASIGRVKALFK